MQKELKKLLKYYTKFNVETNSYEPRALDKPKLIRLDSDFAKLLNEQLLVDGPEVVPIEKNYRKLTRFLHPDRQINFLPEVLWIEHHLSEGKNDGACFKSLTFCCQKLTNPDQFKDVHFDDIKTQTDFKTWLEHLRDEAPTYTSRSFYGSLVDLYDQCSRYFDETGQIKLRGVRFLAKSIPGLVATYGAALLAQELFVLYAVYFVLLKGGQYLGCRESLQLKKLGAALQEISIVTATVSTTVLVRLLEMTFWASRQSLGMTLQIGAAILNPLLAQEAPAAAAAEPCPDENSQSTTTAKLCKDLSLARENQTKGIQFKTPELKVIAAPLEVYLQLNKKQFFGAVRLGNEKRNAVKAILFNLRVLDAMPTATEDKITEAKKELDKLKESPLCTSKTAEAVAQSEQVIDLLCAPDFAVERDASQMQIVVYQPPM